MEVRAKLLVQLKQALVQKAITKVVFIEGCYILVTAFSITYVHPGIVKLVTDNSICSFSPLMSFCKVVTCDNRTRIQPEDFVTDVSFLRAFAVILQNWE